MASYLTSSHWLVAVPSDFGANQCINKFKAAMIEKTGKHLADMSLFEMPVSHMKVGTLDSLMALSDELNRVDAMVESVLKKAERQVAESYNALKTQEMMAKRKGQDETPISVPPLGLRVAGKPVAEYVSKFKWNANTWDPRDPLPDLVKRIATSADRIDQDMRQYATTYQEKRTASQAAERKRSGNLMVAALEDVITPSSLASADAELIPADSEFLCSLVVVLGKVAEPAFLAEYATQYAAQAVPVGPEGRREAEKTAPAVPGSARKIAEDADGYVLYIVVVLKKYSDAFRSACKERRFTVRDFEFNASLSGSGARVAEAAGRETASALVMLKDVSRARYEESMSLWLHLKCVRVFVDSVLKYGLPVAFTTVLFKVVREGSNPVNTGKKLLLSVQEAWKDMSAGGRVVDEGAAMYGVGDGEDEGGAGDLPVIPGVTDAPGLALPFVLIDFEVRTDTAAGAHK